jgi:hypothetical protein
MRNLVVGMLVAVALLAKRSWSIDHLFGYFLCFFYFRPEAFWEVFVRLHTVDQNRELVHLMRGHS